MFNNAIYENSTPDGIGVLEIASDGGPEKSSSRRFVPLKRTELRGEVLGPLASLRLVHTYGYTREQCDAVLEAIYRFPLPGDAAVTGIRVRFGDVEILAALAERREAEERYETARREGRQAGLLTRESPDVFTLHVTGIQPDQEITVETSYVQLARTEGPGWQLRVPLATAPRYVRSDEITSRHAHGQPLLLLRDPGHRFALELALHGIGAVESGTHRLEVVEGEERTLVRLADGEVVPDRDFLLSWRPRQLPDRPALQVLLHDDPASPHLYFLALAASPSTPTSGGGVAREVTMLVDRSGSMEGAKWEAADWAVKKFLMDLTDRDDFGLGLFHSSTRWLSREPRSAERGAVEKALRFLESHRDSGGTELGVALEQALDLKRSASERARHLLIVTDAQVSDEGRILRLADEESARPDRRRISLLCVDAAPNSFLALEMAERGGGVARFLTSSPEAEDISTALDGILADWAQPALAGLRLEVACPAVEAAGRAVVQCSEAGWSAIDLGDLPHGRAVWVAGRVPRESALPAFRLTAGNVRVAEYWPDPSGNDHPGLKPLFGARRVLGLEFLIHSGYSGDDLRYRLRRLGYNPEEVLAAPVGGREKLYAENVRHDAEEALRGLLVREALGFGLACSETAFVAVRREAGRQVEGTVLVANALPSGWSESFLAPPMAAPLTTSGPLLQSAPAMFACAESVADMAAGLAPAFLRRRPKATFGGSGSTRPGTSGRVLFSSVPAFENGEALLFDSSRPGDSGRLPTGTIARLTLKFPSGAPSPASIDPALALLIFVDDPTAPRARASLRDLLRQGGERPLNLRVLPGEVVRVVLVDPAGMWASGAPRIEVAVDLHP